MKVIGINGSPREKWNTAKLIRSALDGAAEAGAETEMIHLYDKSFTGCRSCFACKQLDGGSFGRCGWRDGLTEVLDKTLSADAIILGSPIYFFDVTSAMRGYLERLLYPNCTYSSDNRTVYPKRIPTGMIYTCNRSTPEDFRHITSAFEQMLGAFLGPVKYMVSSETWQFTDYSKYSSSKFDVEYKRKRHEEVFPQDLKKAFDMGKSLASK